MSGPKPAASVKQLILHEHELLASANDAMGPYWELHAEITAEHFIRLMRKLRVKGAEVIALRAANERKAAALRSILHRFRRASENQWYIDAQRALEESPP